MIVLPTTTSRVTLAAVAFSLLALASVAVPAQARPHEARPTPPPPPPGARRAERLDALGAVRYALDFAPALLAQRASIASVDSSFTRARAAEYPTATAQLQNQIAKSRNQSGQFAQFGVSPTSNFSQNTAQLSST